ncbi:MAG: YggT family protein [Steroidobacteraceae bacterium]
MNAILFLVETLLSLVFFVFLLRLLLQWVRADFRNPVAEAVLRLTNWLILPLRRVLPPIGRVDTAAVLAVILCAFVQEGALHYLRLRGWPPPVDWAALAGLAILRAVLTTYLYAIFLYALVGMVAPGVRSPVQAILESLCEPVLRPIRRTIPGVAGLDLSPLWAGIAIMFLLYLIA